MTEVIALAGWSPEVLAYAYAMYSRSALSIRQSLKKITDEKSAKFLETFYFKYGHKSIADNAHVPLSFENISEIAAYELEDEQRWDGQERSTRYQDFGKAGAYYVPQSVLGSTAEQSYRFVAESNLRQYSLLSRKVFENLVATIPCPQDMKKDDYERTLRARAFDVARYWLFNGILTSVGQITSARTLEEQISRMMSSRYQELQDLGQAMKQACIDLPFCPDGKQEPPVASTLVKYTKPNPYTALWQNKVKKFVGDMLSFVMDNKRYVRLAKRIDLIDEIISTAIFEVFPVSYENAIDQARSMSPNQKEEFIKLLLEDRGHYDPLPKPFASGYALQFDICMDRGGERDLHRHRNCIQVHQPLTLDLGWDTPKLLHDLNLADEYNAAMAVCEDNIRNLQRSIGNDADYLIPFAFRSRTLYKQHLAQAVYTAELRSKPGGHFSYREVVCEMDKNISKEYPIFADKFRITPFEQEDPLKR